MLWELLILKLVYTYIHLPYRTSHVPSLPIYEILNMFNKGRIFIDTGNRHIVFATDLAKLGQGLSNCLQGLLSSFVHDEFKHLDIKVHHVLRLSERIIYAVRS